MAVAVASLVHSELATQERHGLRAEKDGGKDPEKCTRTVDSEMKAFGWSGGQVANLAADMYTVPVFLTVSHLAQTT